MRIYGSAKAIYEQDEEWETYGHLFEENTGSRQIFVVDIDADKKMIKKAIEDMFKTKVENVKTYVQKGEKRAYVKFSDEKPAIDIATQLGLM